MKKECFYEGLEVKYKDFFGFVKFVDENYITICIEANENRLRDVCILVFPNEWKDVELISGNRSEYYEK